MKQALRLMRSGVMAAAGGGGTSYADEVSADSPFAWWRFEETSGTTIADEQGTHDGTTSGSPDLTVAGKVDSAIGFDGIDDYVDVGTLGSFGSDMDSGFTMECWLRWDHSNVEDAAGTVNDGTSVILQLRVNADVNGASSAGRVSLQIRENGVDQNNRASDRNDLNDGQWHHIVFTWDGALTTPDIYVDGVLDNGAGRNDDASSTSSFDYGFALGATNVRGTIADHFTGDMDEFALYLAVLSDTRIAAHYNAA